MRIGGTRTNKARKSIVVSDCGGEFNPFIPKSGYSESENERKEKIIFGHNPALRGLLYFPDAVLPAGCR